jgi:hypothetical protein
MKLSLLTGLLAPALFVSVAASQTILAVRPLPFTGTPRILPVPVTPMPLSPMRLPSPLNMPQAMLRTTLPAPVLAPQHQLAAAGNVALATHALPTLSMDGTKELPFFFRRYLPVEKHLAGAVETVEKPAQAPAARPRPVPVPKVAPEKRHRDLERIFDGRRLTLPEDDLEHELGLR